MEIKIIKLTKSKLIKVSKLIAKFPVFIDLFYNKKKTQDVT